MEKTWITTEQLLQTLKNNPDREFEYNVYVAGGALRSTHFFLYDSQEKLFGHTRDWPYDWFSELEFLEYFEGWRWVFFA